MLSLGVEKAAKITLDLTVRADTMKSIDKKEAEAKSDDPDERLIEGSGPGW